MFNTLMYMYPNAECEGMENDDFRLQDDSDGNGVYIAYWNTDKLGQEPTIEEIEAVMPIQEKETFIGRKLLEIDEYNRNMNLEIFVYDTHNYYSDKDSIQAVQNQCLIMTDTDSIPVSGGVWKTADLEADGVTPVFIHFTVAEFKDFSTTFFMRSSNNFAVKEGHKSQIRAMYLDPEKTAQDIIDYDHTNGWY